MWCYFEWMTQVLGFIS